MISPLKQSFGFLNGYEQIKRLLHGPMTLFHPIAQRSRSHDCVGLKTLLKLPHIHCLCLKFPLLKVSLSWALVARGDFSEANR